MPSVRICRVLNHEAASVWRRIADYNTWYEWLPQVAHSRMEHDPAIPAAVGAVRRVGDWDEPRVREELVAQDENRMTLSYGVARWPAWRFPARDYVATVHVLALTEQPGAVVEWASRFDCDQADEDKLVALFEGLYRSFLDGLDSRLQVS